MFSFFYRIFFLIITPLYLLWIAFRSFSRGSDYFFHRIGWGLKSVREEAKGALWFHAVSLGETKALQPVIPKYREIFPHAPVVISSGTETGYSEAKQLFPEAYHLYLPFEPFIRSVVKDVLPKLVIFCETDLWLRFIESADRAVVISAKMSERSAKRMGRYSFYAKALFRNIDRVLAQNETYKKRFLLAHCPQEKIVVTGNIKVDQNYPVYSAEERRQFLESLEVKRPIVVLGSTHEGEEKMLIEALKEEFQLLVVPRHPHRFNEVAKEIEKMGYSVRRLSEDSAKEGIILVDQMGLLCLCYSVADLAVVAGSFIPGIGGHNILEPCFYGTKLLFGPYMEEQFELRDLVLSAGAGEEVTIDQLLSTTRRLLEKKEKNGEGQELLERLKGTVERTVANSLNFMS